MTNQVQEKKKVFSISYWNDAIDELHEFIRFDDVIIVSYLTEGVLVNEVVEIVEIPYRPEDCHLFILMETLGSENVFYDLTD